MVFATDYDWLLADPLQLKIIVLHRRCDCRSKLVRFASNGKEWGYGLIELSAGLGLLGFVLLEEPIAVIYLAMVISGLLGVGAMQIMDGLALAKHADT